jgi:hypothetical protein
MSVNVAHHSGLLVLAAIVLLLVALVAMQPDLGTAVLIRRGRVGGLGRLQWQVIGGSRRRAGQR